MVSRIRFEFATCSFKPISSSTAEFRSASRYQLSETLGVRISIYGNAPLTASTCYHVIKSLQFQFLPTTSRIPPSVQTSAHDWTFLSSDVESTTTTTRWDCRFRIRDSVIQRTREGGVCAIRGLLSIVQHSMLNNHRRRGFVLTALLMFRSQT